MPTMRHTSGPPKPMSCHVSPSGESTPCSTRGGRSCFGSGAVEAARELLAIVVVPFERGRRAAESHGRSYGGVDRSGGPLERQWPDDATPGPPGEVLGGDLLEKCPEFLDLVLFLLFLEQDAGLVEDLVVDHDGDGVTAADGQGDRIGGTRRDALHLVAPGELELGVERAVPQTRDRHLAE